MKILTYLLYILLVTTLFSCGNPKKKRNSQCCNQGIEQKMENDTILTDSVKHVIIKKEIQQDRLKPNP